MNELNDGTPLQDGLTFNKRSSQPGQDYSYIPYPVTGVIRQLYYIDDDLNRDGETIVCDVRCLQLGIDLFKVPWLEHKSSVDNYTYDPPRAATKNVDKSEYNAQYLNPEIADGDSVLIVFANGDVHQPYIIKTIPHNQAGYSRDGTKKACPSPRPKKEKGEAFKKRINGLDIEVDKDGNLNINTTNTFDEEIEKKKKITVNLNAKTESGADETQSTKLEIDNSGTGAIRLTSTNAAGKKQVVEQDAGANKTTILAENVTGENKIILSPTGIEINTQSSKLTLNIDGDVDQTISGDVNQSVTGKAVIDATGDVELTSSGNVKLTGTQIQLNGLTGQVLTTVTQPFIDLITGAPSVGVPTVLAG